jgi:hypothetical protein
VIRTITATQYVTPLREGGSLPAIVEGDDDGTYVVKFRGAGQGPKALIAELVSGEIGRRLGLPVPEIVFVELDARMAKTEPDPEIQDLLQRSAGLNLGLDYLPGSITLDPLVERHMTGVEMLASSIVWFDAFTTNVDRTPRNTNLLVWHRAIWMIDHGASLYFHHNIDDRVLERSRNAFAQIKDHVLLALASELRAADEALSAKVTPQMLEEVAALIPEQWLEAPEHRDIYRAWLQQRIEAPREWVEEAIRARSLRV